LSNGSILPLPQAGPVEVGKDGTLFNPAVLLDCTNVLEEGVTRLGLRAHRQHGPVEGVHQLVDLAEQQGAHTAPPRACPDSTAGPDKPSIIFLVRCAGSAERGQNRARYLVSIHRHPASEFDHRIVRLHFPAGLGVIENRLVRPELVRYGTSRLVEGGPEFVAGGMRVEWGNANSHELVSALWAQRTLMSKVTAKGSGAKVGVSKWFNLPI
jgi:hypothetical protein